MGGAGLLWMEKVVPRGPPAAVGWLQPREKAKASHRARSGWQKRGGRTAKVDATKSASVAIRSRHRNGTVSILIIWSDPNPPRDDSAGPAGHGLGPSPWLPPEPGLRGTVKQERRRTSRRSLLYWSSGLAAQTPDCPGQSRAPQGRMPQLVWPKRGSGLGPPPEMAGPSANQGISGQKKPACFDGPAGRPPRTMWRPPFLHAAQRPTLTNSASRSRSLTSRPSCSFTCCNCSAISGGRGKVMVLFQVRSRPPPN